VNDKKEGGLAVKLDIYWWMLYNVKQLNWFLVKVARDESIKFSKSADGVVNGHITAQLWVQVMKTDKLKEVASIDVLSLYELNQDWILHCIDWESEQGDFLICRDDWESIH